MADGKYDVAIVGGGIIGLSTARTLAIKHPEVKTVVLEKEDTFLPPTRQATTPA